MALAISGTSLISSSFVVVYVFSDSLLIDGYMDL